ncbi:MAG TPA: FecR family protein [Candidatus Limnocylindria bacterium]|nr:FecR family protein [Candidatus Limnocylindria bacterium]
MTHASIARWSSRASVLLVSAMLLVARPAAAEDVGWVAALEGTAEAQRGGQWIPLAQGAAVQLGDHVRTGAASRMKLLFRDDSVLTLAERSELVIDEQVAGAAPTTSFSLLLGKVRAIVTDRYSARGAAFEVRSPTAIAGVRGTSFIAGYDGDRDETQVVGLESITVVRGLVDTTGTRQVRVGPGQSTIVRRGAVPSSPVKLPASAVRVLTGETTASVQRRSDGGANIVAEPRLPRHPGERTGSQEGRVVDQPLPVIRKGPIAPPPPPVR